MKAILISLALASTTAFGADLKTKAANTAKTMEPTQLDDLIRGEMSAVKVYDQVLEKVKDPKEISKLTSIRRDHLTAIETLKRYASADVKEDTYSVGPWGTFATAWTGAAKLMGNDAALKALSQGEEHGISEYKEALADDKIQPDLKRIIKSSLIPKQEEHIKTIKSFM